ncbi:hypothetical protein FSARC_13946 [Fusarium sarcochroum]|uniref:Uncharacterized protein n=1 Tax=Fusarium sarcochroum TaxID=1208366 RepID=A0A8H4SXR5_9HYPO|nr:hypothetical protein FSARC_13946 [Fusarium sarcochroum]
MAPTGAVTDLHGVELPARYEIRRLEKKHGDWVNALTRHAGFYGSEVWAPLYVGMARRLTLQSYKVNKGQVDVMLAKNLSYGIFDKEYEFKRPESAATGGAVYWNDLDEWDGTKEFDGRRELRDAMDFPMVSVVISVDDADQPPKVVPGTSPVGIPHGHFYFAACEQAAAAQGVLPDGNSDIMLEPGVILGRRGTATSDGHSGKGFMKALSQFIIHQARADGFKEIQMHAQSQAVFHVWTNLPSPYRVEVKFKTNLADFETEIDGKMIKPFEKSPGAIGSMLSVFLNE